MRAPLKTALASWAPSINIIIIIIIIIIVIIMDKNEEFYNYVNYHSKKKIIKLSFKNHDRVNLLLMRWQVIESLGSSIKCSFLSRFCTDLRN